MTRIAIWGRETWAVVATGVAWLSGMVAALYGMSLTLCPINRNFDLFDLQP